MLTRKFSTLVSGMAIQRQKGVVLIIALIVLVAMSLGGIALVRSVDTGNLIAGNMAFQQAAVRSSDIGVEAAITWLNTVKNDGVTLLADDDTHGYFASIQNGNPAAGQSWDAFWAASLAANAKTLQEEHAGNRVSYVIHRLCAIPDSAAEGAGCSSSPVVNAATGNAEEGGEVQLSGTSSVYYRITVRSAGPRGTASYVQAVVSL